MTRPQRIQLRRTRGWRKPEGAIVVARPTRWGNPFRVGTEGLSWAGHAATVGDYGGRVLWNDTSVPGGLTAEQTVALYRWELESLLIDDRYSDRAALIALHVALDDLRGHDLACWCPLDQPCHADVLLDVANRRRPR